jgi:hypothetical protein
VTARPAVGRSDMTRLAHAVEEETRLSPEVRPPCRYGRAMDDRWQDDPSSRVPGLLAEIARHRRELDRADEAMQAGCESRYEHSQRSAHQRGARQALDAAVGMAVLDRTPPPDDEVAAAAGLEVAAVAAVRTRLRASPA